jgi:hypothetical protein
MEEQHKEMLYAVRAGRYDGPDMANAARAYQPGQLADDVPKAPPSAPASPVAPQPLLPIPLLELAPVEASGAEETLFGEDLVSEKSLDEVILGYLTSEKDG